ncbi:MAG TPA: DUF2203 domain-containing protein [Candidatus Nanoarchaeia archaeon]|nr:DUF2203 domain-containing protein [Candidatus Nanoarchaeia archaeon]
MRPFTIEQAEKVIPKIERLLKKAQRVREKLSWLLDEYDGVVEVNDEFGFHFFLTESVPVNKEFHRLYYQFYGAIESMNDLGVIVKDIDEGLIDFPFKIGKKEVFLCWQLGEERIEYWHDCESGFEERQKIVDIDELFKRN